MIVHGYNSRDSRHPLYWLWLGMRQRCNNPNHISYKNYGAKGISVCKRWDNFPLFLEDVGNRPSPAYSLDRINSGGDYEPLNVRWATRHEQNSRRSNSNEFTGVRWCHHKNRWKAQLTVNTVRVLDKAFLTKEEAILARSQAESTFMP